MIEKYFTDQLNIQYPTWNISENYYEAEDNIIAVYNEGGGVPDPSNEVKILTPSYMVWLSSSDWGAVAKMAYEIYRLFDNQRYFTVTNYDGVQFYVYMVVGQQSPLRIGVEDGKMQYSINFDVTLREV